MADGQLETAIALFVFNRPSTTARVFEEIRRARPRRLFVIADGPRLKRTEEADLCMAARNVLKKIDWDCEVLTNYSEINLGCRVRLSSGIDWVFQNVEEAIILEDDCLPDSTFFRYCEELLHYYRDDERIMHISGDKFYNNSINKYSYYFSRYTHVWGWASWRRAWKHYDVDLSQWPTIRNSGLLHHILNPFEVRYWTGIFEKVYQKQIDTWDYQWMLACWLQSGLSIIPGVNLISNIGFGTEATHTQSDSQHMANLPVFAFEFPLQHSPFVIRNEESDAYVEKKMFSGTRSASFKREIKSLISNLKSKT